MESSDYIVFADESGDHGLEAIADGFPIFVLVFCVVRKEDYVTSVVPAMQRLKFAYWGHDAVVLHERDIRRQQPPFGFFRTSSELRQRFMDELNGLIESAPIKLYASVIDKRRLVEKYDSPRNPYEIALLFCMERLLSFLIFEGQKNRKVHVLFESRGKREDQELELEFRRIVSNRGSWGYKQPDFTKCDFEPIFTEKKANSTGLQLADLTARPIGLSVLRPDQPNRAMDVIRLKLLQKKCFP